MAQLVALLKETPRTGYAANCIAMRDSDLRGKLGAIGATTLVISGSSDVPTPSADGRYLAQAIPTSMYVELDAVHLSNQELPERFCAAVRDFLLADRAGAG